METQLRKRGMTASKQYREFKALHPETYGETSFYFYYNKWKKKINPSMHIEHKVGDKIYVDYAGATLPYVDADTGEIKQAQVFVAILGWSQYAYVEAMPSQTAEDFIAACENALCYFKGVPCVFYVFLICYSIQNCRLRNSNAVAIINFKCVRRVNKKVIKWE